MAVYDELKTDGTFYIFGTCLKFVPKAPKYSACQRSINLCFDLYLRSTDRNQNTEEAGKCVNVYEANIQIWVSVKFQAKLLYRRHSAGWIPMVS